MRIELSPKIAGVTVFFVLITIYGLFQARFLILGPQLQIAFPKDGENVADPLLTIRGQALNTTFISLNDRPIFVDQSGYFSEKLIAPGGPSIIKFKARDRFGRETEKIIHIVRT
ncbi:hypothetical protein KW790_01855 [Candidatus Parcubacteria bacterium]|nr:hypothetical protein [Candidatus Parcubacteria bacterium]